MTFNEQLDHALNGRMISQVWEQIRSCELRPVNALLRYISSRGLDQRRTIRRKAARTFLTSSTLGSTLRTGDN